MYLYSFHSYENHRSKLSVKAISTYNPCFPLPCCWVCNFNSFHAKDRLNAPLVYFMQNHYVFMICIWWVSLDPQPQNSKRNQWILKKVWVNWQKWRQEHFRGNDFSSIERRAWVLGRIIFVRVALRSLARLHFTSELNSYLYWTEFLPLSKVNNNCGE